jgi:adenylate kinase family enzyme
MTAPLRIQLIGGSGTGKTTVALQLAQRLNLTFCDLDELHWDPNWTEVPDEVMCQRLQPIIAQDRWILAGNYNRMWPTIWPRLDVLVWLDLPLRTKVWRTFKRTLHRALTKQACCNGNYESLPRLFTRDSVVLYLIHTHAQRQREYAALEHDRNRPAFKFVRLRSQAEIDAWLADASQRS